MKKIICLILSLAAIFVCSFSFASCDKSVDVFDILQNSEPTKTVAFVYYTDAKGNKLNSEYTMSVEGNNSIFEYEYWRLRTVEEGFAEGDENRFKLVPGTVYYKDGKYSVDGVNYDTEVPEAQPLTFNITEERLTNIEYFDEERSFTAKMTAENAKSAFGTDLSSAGDLTVTVKTGGKYLRQVVINCTTKSGATVTVDTTYSYNPVTLEFPGVSE